MEEKRKRGRPPLSEEEKALRQAASREKRLEYTKNYIKEHGYSYQKKYQETHKEQIRETTKKYQETHKDKINEINKKYKETHSTYAPRIYMPTEARDIVLSLKEQTSLSVSELFIIAFEEKYNVKLRK